MRVQSSAAIHSDDAIRSLNESPRGPSWRVPWWFSCITGSLMVATRALYCCADTHVADAAVLGSGESAARSD